MGKVVCALALRHAQAPSYATDSVQKNGYEHDSLAKRYAKDTDEESDEAVQFSGKEGHDVHITPVQQGEFVAEAHYQECDAHSFVQLPAPTTVSDVDSDYSEVDMGKLKGRRAASSPSA